MFICDPALFSATPPGEVYSLPAIVQDPTDPSARTAIWAEHHGGYGLDITRDSYYFVRFEELPSGVGPPRGCSVVSELSEGLSHPATTSSGLEGDQTTGAPVVYGPPPAAVVVLNPWQGWINRYPIDGSGAPNPWLASTYDTTPADIAGGDVSLLVDANLGVLFSPFKCQRASGGGVYSSPCDSTATRFGRLEVRELDAPSVLLDDLRLNAWISSAPVRVSDTAGPQEYTLIAFGTDESTNVEPATGLASPPECGGLAPYDTANDCALVTALWDGSSISIAGHWDEEAEGWADTCCVTGSGAEVDGANGFVGEPVPYGTDRLFALRRRAELDAFEVDLLTGAPSRRRTVRIVDTGGGEVRVPAEHSLVIGAWPGQPTTQRIFFAVNVDDGGTSRGHVLVLDPDNLCPTSTPCTIDPEVATAHLVGTVVGPTPFWGPPVAVRLQRTVAGATQTALGVAIVTDTLDDGQEHVDSACAAGPIVTEVAPTLHLWWKQSVSDPAWTHETLPLASSCHVSGPEGWKPIVAPSGVVVGGSALYVALSDGNFREYSSVIAQQGDPSQWRIQGYSGPWPRMRFSNHNTAARP